MAPVMFFPTLMPKLQIQWHLSNTEAGFINGVFFGGYALSAPLLVGLTDRLDTRRIYLFSAVLGGLSQIGFSLFADGVLSASVLRFAAGISLAGTYMPGLKVLSERITGTNQSRAISFYTASYGLGMALSVFFSGLILSWPGVDLGQSWRMPACLLAAGSGVTAVLFAVMTAGEKKPAVSGGSWADLLDFRRILRNRPAVGYILGYGVHCWELFGYRSWLVAFLFAGAAFQADAFTRMDLPAVAGLIILAGVPASILGNEMAVHRGRRRVITLFMLSSGLIGCLIGFAVASYLPVLIGLCFLYGIAVMLDSGALTSGLVMAAGEGEGGRTMALYSFVGFIMATAAPLAFGAVLDLLGEGPLGWGTAFAVLGLAGMTGPVWLKLFSSGRKPLP